MAKINKVYPPFFNGVSQQKPELILDNQCKAMDNCVPDLVLGLTKRPPVKHVKTIPFSTSAEMASGRVFHSYDRGEDDEEYIFVETSEYDHPVHVFHKDGTEMVVEYDTDNETAIKDYLANGGLKALTVQDRTWVFSKNAEVGIDYTDTSPLQETYDRVAYYWIKRGSGDRYNPFNYAVYLNGTTFAVNPDKPSNATADPATGAEDSDWAANDLASKINGATTSLYKSEVYVDSLLGLISNEIFLGKNLTSVSAPILTYISGSSSTSLGVSDWNYNATTGMYTYALLGLGFEPATFSLEITAANTAGFTAEVKGSILKIYKDDGSDFTFSSWDSWGNQASEGWKGSVNKITDLPKDMPFDGVYVKIEGEENNNFTDYFVHWSGSSWVECLDPTANRGKLTNMPIKLDRTSLVSGVATFTFNLIDWSEPRVGNLDNNPDPSFAPDTDGYTSRIQDLFFYKNRLGIASEDAITLSETANYTNFYATTVVDIVDTDVIDITIATNQASKIHYAKPFNNSLYIFTKYAQYELVAEGAFSPSTVSLINTTNYPMATDVEPVVVNDSLYFISTTANQQQLREYIKTDKLSVKGVDLNVSTPTYLEQPIKKLVADGVLGYVLCCTDTNLVYLYNFKEDGDRRIQSAWSTWTLLEGLTTTANSYEYAVIESALIVVNKTANDYRYHTLQLDYNVANDNVDTSSDGTTETEYSYTSSVTLPDYYPQMTNVRTPLHKILIKKVTIEGEGSFDADVYRKDYDVTFTKSHTQGLADLDLHVSSKVGNAVITLKDSSADDFVISSIVVEGLLTTTSRELK